MNITVAVFFLLVGAILMGVSAFFEPVRPSLYKLAWMCFFLYFLFGVGSIQVQ